MKIINHIVLIALLSLSFQSDCLEKSIKPTMQSIISQWFSIDENFDIKMKKIWAEETDKFSKYNLSFTSDDQNNVNGVLALPKNQEQPLKLAFLLHAMGSDQNLWWTSNKLSGDKISTLLLQQGYAVVTLDARRHGQRKVDNFGPKDMIAKARSDQPRLYNDMIIGTVRDYRLVFKWLKKNLKLDSTSILVSGYSMGAQMSLLLASYESEINQVMVMVPPYVNQVESPVAPRLHVSRINEAELILLAAEHDPYSTQENYQEIFNNISTPNKSIKWFDSGHLLPANYYEVVFDFMTQLSTKSKGEAL